MYKLLILILSILFLFTSCIQQKVQKETIKTVKISAVEQFGDEKKESFPGKVRASSEINVAFRISGPIVGIHVKEGQFVQKGQVLAEMDSRDYAIQFSATEAEYNQIKAEAERIIQLYELQSVSENDYDKAISGLKQITAKYNAHKNALEDTKLIAPFDGYVQKRFFDKGETIGAGMPVFSMISTNSPEVVVNIPVAVYIQSDKFDFYTCLFELFPGKEYNLELISINAKANMNQLHQVQFRLNKNDDLPKPLIGTSTMVTIHFKKENTGMVLIPNTALFEKDGIPTVWIYDNNEQKVTARNIVLYEIKTDGNIVVSEGLKTGEQVVSAGVHLLSEGEKVRLIPEASQTNVGGLLFKIFSAPYILY